MHIRCLAALVGLITTAALCAGADASPEESKAAAATAVLRVRAADLRNERGTVRVGVFASAKGFPNKREAAVRWASVPADAADPAVTIDLPPGRYAVVVVHDEDSDKKLDSNLVGVPTEGYGVTNNPKPRYRAATFREAAFDLGPDGAEQTVEIQYF